MLFLLLFFGIFPSICHAVLDSEKPVVVTVSPKIWTLLKQKDNLVKEAIQSVKLEDIDQRSGGIHVRAWDGKVDNFSINPTSISFQNTSNGVHLRVENVNIHISYKGRMELGKQILGFQMRISRANGKLGLKCENASLDVKLQWDDFKFKPSVSMTSSISVEFANNLKMLKHIKKAIDKRSSMIHEKISEKIAKLIEEKLNPKLQELKTKAAARGISNCDVEFKVHGKILHAICKPKNGSAQIPPIKSVDKMLCIDATLVKSKPKEASQTKRTNSKLSTNSTKQNSVPLPTEHKSHQNQSLIVTCVASERKCEHNHCNYCVDIDVDFSSKGSKENYENCSPKFL